MVNDSRLCCSSPEDSSDGSCMSVEEDPAAVPGSVLPLRDAVVTEGSEVTLGCVTAGHPYQGKIAFPSSSLPSAKRSIKGCVQF